jgi:hypothetical protein
MKKLILAAVVSVFGFVGVAHACDGMKGHEKSEKTSTQAKKEKKADDQKS